MNNNANNNKLLLLEFELAHLKLKYDTTVKKHLKQISSLKSQLRTIQKCMFNAADSARSWKERADVLELEGRETSDIAFSWKQYAEGLEKKLLECNDAADDAIADKYVLHTQNSDISHKLNSMTELYDNASEQLRLVRKTPIHAILHNAICDQLLISTTKIPPIKLPKPTIDQSNEDDAYAMPIKKKTRDRKHTRREIQQKDGWHHKKMQPPTAFLVNYIKTDPRYGKNRRSKRSGKNYKISM